VRLTDITSGMCIGVAGDGVAQPMTEYPRLFIGAMLILIFDQVLGLYGFIVFIIVINNQSGI
jgi:V-type H+-transporting ATPase proteolipid subunit